MTSVGEVLRAARETQGRQVAEVAEELCLTQSYLRALEADDYKNLPGIFFYKSFARQYAALLHVDLKLIQPGLSAVSDVDSTVSATANPKPPIRPLDPIVIDTNRRYFANHPLGLSVAGLAAVLLLCSGFYSWWTRAPQPVVQTSTPAAPVVIPVSQPGKPAAVAPDPALSGASSPDASSPDAASPDASSPDASSPGATSPGALSPGANQPANSPAGTAPLPTGPAADASHSVSTVSLTTTTDAQNHVVLHLSATEKTWLSITSNGKQIFAGILQPSQSKILTGAEQATMKVGNAGGLDVQLNGKPIGPIGPSGQVRTVVFTPDNFQILTAADRL